MESKRYGREIVLRVDDCEELLHALETACKEHAVRSARVSGIGALKNVQLRVLNPTMDGFLLRDFNEPMEITSLSGDITADRDNAFLHLHLTAATGEMQVIGGHIMHCIIASTAEIWITETENGTVHRSKTAEGLLRKIEF